jgi:NADH-ubiquinone oxidoreductase subunit 10
MITEIRKSPVGRAVDPVGYLQDVEQRSRERAIAIETVRLLRQRVIACYRKEGVNHYENCRKEASDYYEVITKRDLGQVQPSWANPEMKDGWS